MKRKYSSDLPRLWAALESFAEVGQWLLAREHISDDEVMVEFHGLNGYKIKLTRGHFKAAHRALHVVSPRSRKPREGEAARVRLR